MANVNIRVDDAIKEEAEAIFEKLGLSMSLATNIFYKQVIRSRGYPFELRLHPNPAKMSKEELEAEIQKINSEF